MRRIVIMVFCLAAFAAVFVVPQRSLADSPVDGQKKEEAKRDTEKKATKEKNRDKAKSGRNPVDVVNKTFDEFKKNQGGVKDDAKKVRKSVNDAWDKVK